MIRSASRLAGKTAQTYPNCTSKNQEAIFDLFYEVMAIAVPQNERTALQSKHCAAPTSTGAEPASSSSMTDGTPSFADISSSAHLLQKRSVEILARHLFGNFAALAGKVPLAEFTENWN